MGVEEYVTLWKQGKLLNDTLIHQLYQGAVELNKSLLNADGVIDAGKLSDVEAGSKSTRESCTSKFHKQLEDFAASYLHANLTDSYRRRELVQGLFGVSLEYVKTHLETVQADFTLTDFVGYLARDGLFRHLQTQRLTERPKSALSDDDATGFIKKMKETRGLQIDLEGRIDPQRLTSDDMGELLNQALTEGAISDRFLRGKRYTLKSRIILP